MYIACLCPNLVSVHFYAIPILHFKFPKFFIYLYVYTCIALRGVLTLLLQESQGLITYAFLMLLLAMISLHMLTFRLMVTMVAEFCSLVILIHNTLLGEITISST